MKQRKKIFVAVAMSLYFSICTDAVSFAQDVQREIVQGAAEESIQVQGLQGEGTQVATPAAIIKYKEKAYNCPIKKLTNVETMRLKMIPSGEVQFELSDYWSKEIWNIARVTYDSKGKKQVKKGVRANLGSNKITLYSDRGYTVKNKTLVVGKRIKSGKKVSWKILKKIKFDVSKYQKKKKDAINFAILEVTGKNTVKLVYSHLTGSRYCGIIQVNITTGKVKKLIAKDGNLGIYDGKYLYERKLDSGKLNFCCTSLKTKKVEQFTVDSELLSEKLSWEYEHGVSMLGCYNRNIMVLGADGKIYYGTFDSKKLEQVGDISACKNYKKYEVCGFAMKSKNEFYISYSPKIKKGMEYDHTYGRVFVAKYYKP